MPTNPAQALAATMATKKSEVEDFPALLVLVPLAICLFSVWLAAEFPAFAGAVDVAGLE
jgi:hypothetical protein